MTALNKQAQQVRHWSRMASMTSERVSCVSVEQLDEIANTLESAERRIADYHELISSLVGVSSSILREVERINAAGIGVKGE